MLRCKENFVLLLRRDGGSVGVIFTEFRRREYFSEKSRCLS
jgi:hypothetical protein